MWAALPAPPALTCCNSLDSHWTVPRAVPPRGQRASSTLSTQLATHTAARPPTADCHQHSTEVGRAAAATDGTGADDAGRGSSSSVAAGTGGTAAAAAARATTEKKKHTDRRRDGHPAAQPLSWDKFSKSPPPWIHPLAPFRVSPSQPDSRPPPSALWCPPPPSPPLVPCPPPSRPVPVSARRRPTTSIIKRESVRQSLQSRPVGRPVFGLDERISGHWLVAVSIRLAQLTPLVWSPSGRAPHPSIDRQTWPARAVECGKQ